MRSSECLLRSATFTLFCQSFTLFSSSRCCTFLYSWLLAAFPQSFRDFLFHPFSLASSRLSNTVISWRVVKALLLMPSLEGMERPPQAGQQCPTGFPASTQCMTSFRPTHAATNWLQVRCEQRHHEELLRSIWRSRQYRCGDCGPVYCNPISCYIQWNRSQIHPRHRHARVQRMCARTHHQLWRSQPRTYAIP
jgi:hypothetical protein